MFGVIFPTLVIRLITKLVIAIKVGVLESFAATEAGGSTSSNKYREEMLIESERVAIKLESAFDGVF